MNTGYRLQNASCKIQYADEQSVCHAQNKG